jgi:hypothetical protein
MLCGSDRFAKRSLYLCRVGAKRREEHPVEAVQFGRPPALLKSLDECSCLLYRFKRF